MKDSKIYTVSSILSKCDKNVKSFRFFNKKQYGKYIEIAC